MRIFGINPPLRHGVFLSRYSTTTPSGCACHPSTGGELTSTILIQIRHNHPVRLRLPPLHRRGIDQHYTYTDTTQPPRQAAPATPPKEGNVLMQTLFQQPRIEWIASTDTTRSGGYINSPLQFYGILFQQPRCFAWCQASSICSLVASRIVEPLSSIISTIFSKRHSNLRLASSKATSGSME